MLKKKSPKEFFHRGKEKSLENYTEGINGSRVDKKLTAKVLRDYRGMIDL